MDKSFEKQKAIWQKYTDEELTNNDIDEINSNLRDFARVLIKLHRELSDKEKKEEN